MHIHLTPKDIERFWSKVDRSGGPSMCWPWVAGFSANGYGNFWVKAAGGPVNAHRVALIISLGGYDDRLQALHTCDNKPCCNPAHLYVGTARDNTLDWVDRSGYTPAYLRGSSNGMSKLTEDDVRAILNDIADGRTQSDLAREFGVNKTTINAIAKGHTWPHIKRA